MSVEPVGFELENLATHFAQPKAGRAGEISGPI